MKKKSLFGDEDAKEKDVELRVNEKFAKRFEVRGVRVPTPPPVPCCSRAWQSQDTVAQLHARIPVLQHNQARVELERLQRKYPEQAARLSGAKRGAAGEEVEESSDEEEVRADTQGHLLARPTATLSCNFN